MFAAYRAIETQEVDALFQDPMAEALAGQQAMQQVHMVPQGFQRVAITDVFPINVLNVESHSSKYQ